jgi:glyoxalase family protein
MSELVQGHHHITLCVEGAQEDYAFHTGLLGMRSVKKTVLFDGTTPIYHLYYGNHKGDPSTLITTFPFKQAGIYGRRGSGQIKTIQLSVPKGAIGFWAKRLEKHSIKSEKSARYGQQRLHFAHPCGIEYEFVEVEQDARPPITGKEIGADVALRGVHGIEVSVRDKDSMQEFLSRGFSYEKTGEEGPRSRYQAKNCKVGNVIEILQEPSLPQGTWTFGAGTVHHCAFKVNNLEEQTQVKAYLEGLGFTDVSDSKDRKYFHSIYFRTPGGALFEAAYSIPESFEVDEPLEQLGKEFQLPPWFEDRRAELLAKLEKIDF